ncbi:hypothetical protein BH11VER1_BH11VER1_34410 [soil metagenome]
MKYLIPSILFLLPSLMVAQPAAPASAAAASKLTDEQTASIIKQLDQIEAQITKNRGDSFSNALSRFKAGAANDKDALSLYLDCYKLEHFDRKDLKQTDFQEWRDKNEEKFKDPEFLLGLRLQLEFLVICIQAQDATEVGPMVPALQSFIPKAVSAVQSTMTHSASGALKDKDKGKGAGGGNGGRQLLDTLKQPVTGTVFCKAYLLDDLLKREDWEYSPLGINAIYQTIILPYYLKNKPAEIPAQWEARINAELVLRKAVTSETEYQLFYKENYPQLLWTKNNYLLKNNVTPILALADMLKIVRDNPTHANANTWVKELREAVLEIHANAINAELTSPVTKAPDIAPPAN